MDYRRIEKHEVGDVILVRFKGYKLIDYRTVQEMGRELWALVEDDNAKKLVVSFSGVGFIGQNALGKLITLNKKAKAHKCALRLCSIRPEIYEVFAITRLDRTFSIKDDEAEALESF